MSEGASGGGDLRGTDLEALDEHLELGLEDLILLRLVRRVSVRSRQRSCAKQREGEGRASEGTWNTHELIDLGLSSLLALALVLRPLRLRLGGLVLGLLLVFWRGPFGVVRGDRDVERRARRRVGLHRAGELAVVVGVGLVVGREGVEVGAVCSKRRRQGGGASESRGGGELVEGAQQQLKRRLNRCCPLDLQPFVLLPAPKSHMLGLRLHPVLARAASESSSVTARRALHVSLPRPSLALPPSPFRS